MKRLVKRLLLIALVLYVAVHFFDFDLGGGSYAFDYENLNMAELSKLEICRNLFFGYDYTPFYEGSDLQRGMTISGAVNFIVAPNKEEQKQAFIKEALMLKKLIAEQVKVYKRTNLVKSESFSELIQQTLNRYLNGMLTNDDNGA